VQLYFSELSQDAVNGLFVGEDACSPAPPPPGYERFKIASSTGGAPFPRLTAPGVVARWLARPESFDDVGLWWNDVHDVAMDAGPYYDPRCAQVPVRRCHLLDRLLHDQ